MVERQARDLDVRGLNLGPGSNFSLGFKMLRMFLEGEHQLLDHSEIMMARDTLGVAL